MSPEDGRVELREKTQELLHGALRNARLAALAASLVPLGTVAVVALMNPTVAQATGSAPPSVPEFPELATNVLAAAGAGAVGAAAWWRQRRKK